MRRSFLSVVALLLLSPNVAEAFDIDLGPLGHACDTCGGGVVGGLPVIGPILNEAQAQAAGNALAPWISESRNTAANGALPIPSEIRRMLTGYSTERSMNRARYKIGDNGFANLAHVLEHGGFAEAVTLDDIIVFRGPSEASDPATWAHELHHVDQYGDWGVHKFAIRYARDYHDVEDPAYAKGDGYAAWAQNNQPTNGGNGGWVPDGQGTVVNFPPPPPPALGMFCYTPNGRFGPGPLQPLGSPCWIGTPVGPVWGQVGP